MLNRINLIRAISCVLIAVFHTAEFLNANATSTRIPFTLASPGFHLFLLISGVVLVYTTRPDDTPFALIAKRVTRLAPLYWLMTLVAIGLASWRGWILPFADLSLESIAKSFLFLPHEDLNGQLRPILFVGWTLNYLIIFYFLFALSQLAPKGIRPLAVVAALLAVMGIGALLPDASARAFYSRPILLEFATGVLLGSALHHARVVEWIKRTPMTPLLVIGLIGMFAVKFLGLTGATEVLAYCLTGAMVVVAAAGQDMHGAPIKNRAVVLAGALAYPILLVHPLIIPVLGAPVVARIGDDGVRAAIIAPSVLVASVIAAYVVHVALEKPINNALRRLLKLKRSPVSPATPSHS